MPIDFFPHNFYKATLSLDPPKSLTSAEIEDMERINAYLKRIDLHKKWWPKLCEIQKLKSDCKTALYNARLEIERLPDGNSPHGIKIQDSMVYHEQELTKLNREESDIYSKLGCALSRNYVFPMIGNESELRKKLAYLKGKEHA